MSLPSSPEDPGAGCRVVVLGRPGCHLCDDVYAVVDRVCGDLGQAWAKVSIDADPQLRTAYGEWIPVVLVDGIQVAHWRVAEDTLRAALGV